MFKAEKTTCVVYVLASDMRDINKGEEKKKNEQIYFIFWQYVHEMISFMFCLYYEILQQYNINVDIIKNCILKLPNKKG